MALTLHLFSGISKGRGVTGRAALSLALLRSLEAD
jgi:hypothetical protein